MTDHTDRRNWPSPSEYATGVRLLPLERSADPVWPSILRVVIATVAFCVVVAVGLGIAT